MAKAPTPTDVFMQFAAWSLVWPGVTTVLTEAAIKTGLSIRGGIMWLIHMVELINVNPSVDANAVDVSLSVRDGLNVLPQLDDPGCLAQMRQVATLSTNGRSLSLLPHTAHFLPPIPLAAPNLSLYAVSSIDDAALDGDEVVVRVGYTTSPLDARSYAEIAETWAYV